MAERLATGVEKNDYAAQQPVAGGWAAWEAMGRRVGHKEIRGMDYRVRRTKAELDSSGYMEIGPGQYSGKHWQDGFLFVWEDAFGMAEGIIVKHYPDYDHLT